MTGPARRLLEQAALLPDEAQLELIDGLLARLTGDERREVALKALDGRNFDDSDAARDGFGNEIERRARRVLSEGPSGDDWQTVSSRVRARVKAELGT